MASAPQHMTPTQDDNVDTLRQILLNRSASIAARTRAAFWLRERKDDPHARSALRAALHQRGDSCLLRHELAYILGQLGYTDSVEDLCAIVNDDEDDAIVRHEAAEALGAIGDERAKPILQAHLDDGAPEVRETCQLALDLFAWRAKDCTENVNAFRSVDPAPPADTSDSLDNLRQILLSSATSLWNRYRAMFRLRDIGTQAAIRVLAEAVTLSRDELHSDLLRHELAFVLGQLADEAAAPALKLVLRDTSMHPMVRHEAAEALGAMDPLMATDILSNFASDKSEVVAESCVVALDAMASHIVRQQINRLLQAYYNEECR